MQIVNIDLVTAKPFYDRAAIMRNAWAIAHGTKASGMFKTYREAISRALALAWHKAKQEAALQLNSLSDSLKREREAMRPADELKAEIISLECKDRLGYQGQQRLSELKTAYYSALKKEGKPA